MAAMSGDTYRVVVTREDGRWLADVPSLEGAHTYARSLPTLDQAVREVVVLAADLPDEAMPSLVLDYDYHTGDASLDATAREVRQLRREPTNSPLLLPLALAGPPPSWLPGDCQCAMSPPCSASVPSASPSSRPGQAELPRLLQLHQDRRATSVQLATVTREQPRGLVIPVVAGQRISETNSYSWSPWKTSATGRRAPARAGMAVRPATTMSIPSTAAASHHAGGWLALPA